MALRERRACSSHWRSSGASLRAISRAFNPGVPMYAIIFAVAFVSPLASVFLSLAVAAFYLPSAALFAER